EGRKAMDPTIPRLTPTQQSHDVPYPEGRVVPEAYFAYRRAKREADSQATQTSQEHEACTGRAYYRCPDCGKPRHTTQQSPQYPQKVGHCKTCGWLDIQDQRSYGKENHRTVKERLTEALILII